MNFWPFRKPKRVQVQVVLSTQIRFSDWVSSPEMVASAQKLFRTPEFQAMLSILRNESPGSSGLSGTGVTHDDQIAHAYKAAGYAMAVNTLEAFAIYEKKRGALVATFEQEAPRPSNRIDVIPDLDAPPVNRM